MKKIILIFIFLFSSLLSDPFLGVNVEGINITKKVLQDVEEETGFLPGFVNFFIGWPQGEEFSFPKDALSSIWEGGAVPCITWEPMSYNKEIAFFEEILLGKYDEYLLFFSKELKKWNKPVVIRFAHEMNLASYHWGVSSKDYNENYPVLYKKTFQYLYLFLKEQGVENALLAFCPNAESVPRDNWNSLQNYYPGDKYVDILGLDGYSFDGKKSFKEIFAASFEELKKINSQKPFFIFETASSDNGKRKIWIEEALKTASAWKITALLWFQINKEKNWKIKKNEREVFENIKSSSPQKWIKEAVYEKRRSSKKY